MAKIIFRLPSKAIQYGYVEVEASPEELGFEDVSDPNVLGAIYATYVGAFLEGEKGGLDLFMRGRPESAPESLTVGQEVAQNFMGRTEHVEEAVRVVRESRTRARTDEELMEQENAATPEEAVAILQKELGVTVVSEEAPPWERKAEAKQPKPWEKKAESAPPKGAAPKVADINW